jgi:hypothetical protein
MKNKSDVFILFIFTSDKKYNLSWYKLIYLIKMIIMRKSLFYEAKWIFYSFIYFFLSMYTRKWTLWWDGFFVHLSSFKIHVKYWFARYNMHSLKRTVHVGGLSTKKTTVYTVLFVFNLKRLNSYLIITRISIVQCRLTILFWKKYSWKKI